MQQELKVIMGYQVRWNFGDRTPPEGVRRKGRSTYTRRETCLHGAQHMAARGAHAVAWQLWNRGGNKPIGEYQPAPQEPASTHPSRSAPADAHPGGERVGVGDRSRQDLGSDDRS